MNQLTKQPALITSGAIAIAFLNGCAVSKDYISVNYAPQSNVTQVTGAEHVTVQVEMSDVRAIHDRVGNKKNGYGMDMAPIIATNDSWRSCKKRFRPSSRIAGSSSATAM